MILPFANIDTNRISNTSFDDEQTDDSDEYVVNRGQGRADLVTGDHRGNQWVTEEVCAIQEHTHFSSYCNFGIV